MDFSIRLIATHYGIDFPLKDFHWLSIEGDSAFDFGRKKASMKLSLRVYDVLEQ